MQRWLLVAVIAGLHLLAFAIGLFLRRRRQRRRLACPPPGAAHRPADAPAARRSAPPR